jgi:hypothetical protein
MHRSVLSTNELDFNTSLRLSVVAALAIPDGTMTASGLRREAARGRLVIGLHPGSRQRQYGRQYGGRPAESPSETSGHSREAMANAFGVP